MRSACGALVDRAWAFGLSDERRLPRLDDIESAARREGLGRTSQSPEQVRTNTVARISSTRAATALVVLHRAE